MPTIGGWEILLILGVLVMLFGATRLPTAARSLGQSMRIFKAETKGLRSDQDEDSEQSGQQQPAQRQPSPPEMSQPQMSQPPQPAPQALPSSGPHVVRTPAEELQRRDTSR
ncbi:MAG: Sec-independent protein translocase subunit TatA [Pseudonocardiales bacterium]